MRAFQIIIGIILLIPGLCSLAFMSGGMVLSGLWIIWLPCFLVSAVGVRLIMGPVKTPNLRNYDDQERKDEGQK